MSVGEVSVALVPVPSVQPYVEPSPKSVVVAPVAVSTARSAELYVSATMRVPGFIGSKPMPFG